MPILLSPEMAKHILRGRKTLTIRPNCFSDLGTIENILVVGDRVIIQEFWAQALTHCSPSIDMTCLQFCDAHALKLKDLDEEIAMEDGFKSLAELKQFWKNKTGSWEENTPVFLHKFKTITTSEKCVFLPITVNDETMKTEGYSLFGYDYHLEPIFECRARFEYCLNSQVNRMLSAAACNKEVLSLTVRGDKIVEAKNSPVTTTDIFE